MLDVLPENQLVLETMLLATVDMNPGVGDPIELGTLLKLVLVLVGKAELVVELVIPTWLAIDAPLELGKLA